MAEPKSKAPAKGRAVVRELLPLPPGVDALLGKAQLCSAMGASLRKFQGMLSAGEFPAPDTYLGQNPRWSVSTFNAWVAARKAAGPAKRG